MNREEAILHMTLRREELKLSVGDLDEDIKAFDMAIKALEQEPCDKYIKEIDHLRKYISKLETQIVEQEPCEDAISRAEVLDIIDSKDPNYEVRHFKEDVECLPSVSVTENRWIPVSEKLPEENEYIGDVCKYYLIQDEYGDMHVAHLSNVGWIPMDSLKAIGNEVIAWMPLPEPMKVGEENC